MTDLSTLEEKFKKSIDGLNSMWGEVKSTIETAAKDSDEELTKLRTEYSEVLEKYKEAKKKIDHIDNQLAQTVEKLETMSKSSVKGVDAMKLLDVYLVLMEQVFDSGPHVRLLLMLHGDKSEYSLNDLVSASGISGIQVRQALFELRNAGVLTYDDETQTAILTQRFLN